MNNNNDYIRNLVSFEQLYTLERKTIKNNNAKSIIAEIAGKDSIAAIIPILNQKKYSTIIGIGVCHRSFYGNFKEPIEHFKFIQDLKEKHNLDNVNFIYLDLQNLFDFLIIQTMGIVQKYFHFYSPCPACHLFFHMMRIPIARLYGITEFITGERNIHGSREKLNQMPEILDLFNELIQKEGITLLQPIKNITEDQEIFQLLGPTWKNAPPFLCTFSGNYYDENGKIPYDLNLVKHALTDYYFPLFSEVLRFIEREKREPEKQAIQSIIQKIVNEMKKKKKNLFF